MGMSVSFQGRYPNPDQAINNELMKKIKELIEQMISDLPQREVHFGVTPPEEPKEGDFWFHSDENRLYAYVVE